MIIRKYSSPDCKHLVALFYDTVHNVNSKDYTLEQLNAWTSGSDEFDEWDRSFSDHYTIVVEIDGTIVGFGDIDSSGYLDRLYVHKDYQRKGIATLICNNLEKNFPKVSTHSSITAKHFFLNRGYIVVKEQQVLRKGILLTNYVMTKTIC